SKCFITVSVGMVLAIRCHRQNMKTSIINGSEVSRLSVAIHSPNPQATEGRAILLYNYTKINRLVGDA
ncbi:hypothetical protein ACWIVX_16270, partial [Enterobacter asburiae]